MKTNKFEFIHRTLLLIFLILCLGSSIFGMYRSVLDIMALTKSGIFEAILIMIANIFMFICVLFVLIRVIMSYKSGSIFMKELMLTYNKKAKKRPMIISIIITTISLALMILFILMLSDVVINKVFPKGLDAALVTFSFLLFVGGVFFLSYPYAIMLDEKNNKV